MKPLYKLFLAAFAFPVFSFTLSSCKPKEQPQPDAEYFNCEINGKYWTYKPDKLGFNPCSGIGAGPSGMTSWVLGARDCIGEPKTSITIFLSGGNSFPDRDTFDLSFSNRATIVDPYPITSGQSGFSTNDTLQGLLIFTQRDTFRVKGLFYFDVYDAAKKDYIHVTNGKFSIKL